MESKLSLTAAFDDLMRKEKVLQKGIESEFRQFVLSQERCRQKWSATEAEIESLQSRIRKLEEENSSLQTRLKHARHQIEAEGEKRRMMEKETKRFENQVCLINEILNDRNGRNGLNDHDRERLASLSNTCMSFQRSHVDISPSKRLTTINESTHSILSDCEYDKTEDELQVSYLRSGRAYKRPSAPPMEDDPPKRRKSKEDEDHDNSIVTTTTVTIGVDGKPISAEAEVRTVKKLNKSFSEPALDKCKDEPERDADSEPESEESYLSTPRTVRRKSKGILKSTPYSSETPHLRKANSASKGLNRVHFFMSKTILKPETCAPCGKRIKFGKLAMRCKDCRSTCHPECRDNLPLPCVPTAPSTPGAHKFMGGMISDFAPIEPPMIPAIVVHCVNEVEARGLTEVGIYRVPGAESQVKELKKEFLKGKGVPNLSHIDDINVVCGCLKDFLRGLKEPLITYGLWQEFVHAAENRDPAMGISETYQAVSKLPSANKDTLAFLILHLIKVSECKECKMPPTNLAKVFGPTIIGYSVPDPEPLQMITETKYQALVMEKLFALPIDYWESFLNVDSENIYPNQYTPKTPDNYGAQSMLGPLHTPGSYERRGTSKNTFTPSRYDTYGPSNRFANKSRQMSKKPSHFFSSPMLN
ncbi:hypothetical protein FSP39_010635 [Pinctada imbricata]|uniref:Rac GTPase-activating protein 1 n=1 Tax=Pinctada imbricata TaxID=66713 RepID=A0AA88YX58_PINIB|nr:hypothetical protein FSP39_010635 [Pinctada imbricata]